MTFQHLCCICIVIVYLASKSIRQFEIHEVNEPSSVG